jgi:hypothetical protein
MAKQAIPDTVRQQVEEIVEAFNRGTVKDPSGYFLTRYKGTFLYLDRLYYGGVSQICRLKYKGDMAKWEFAVFKYSSGTYSADEWLFPGSGHVDGTIKGALKAGLEAYS